MSIKKDFINGVFWIALSKYLGFVIQILITAILARLLTPESFGIIAIALIFITFFNLLSDFGIGPAIIQIKDLSKKDINDIFGFTIYAGLFFAILFFLLSYPLSNFYEIDELRNILQILTLDVVFMTWNIVPNALILKEAKFKIVSLRTIFLQLFSGVLSIIAALHGWGINALIISPIVTAIGLFFINFYYTGLDFTYKFSISPLRKIFSFSIYQLLFNISNYFFRNLDKLLIGRYLSMRDLGYYDKSYHLMLVPLYCTSSIFNQVLHPILSNLQSNYHELTEKYNKIIKLLAFISFPLGTYLFFTSEEIVMICFGSQWRAAVSVFHILSVSIPLQLILTTVGSIYQAAGDTKSLFYTGIASSLITIIGFIVSLEIWGSIESVAWSWNVTFVISFMINFVTLYKITLRESLTSMLSTLIPPLLLSIICSSLLVIYDYCFSIDSYLINLFLKGVIVLSISLLALHAFKIVNLSQLKEIYLE